MKRHLSNAFYGALDYASYPVAMLAAAPIVLRHLGAAEYGLWMIATAILSAGSILATGFCDVSIQRVAFLHVSKQPRRLPLVVQSILAINLGLACMIAAIVWICAPLATAHIISAQSIDSHECLIALRIASIAILLRAAETVSVSTQRALQRYGATVRISVAIRLLTIASAAALACLGFRCISMMLATTVLLALSVVLQFRQLPIRLNLRYTTRHAVEIRRLLRTGSFAWLQTFGSLCFRQFDRILLGISLGAAAVAPYALCIQLAEPLFGLTASSLSFLLPFLAEKSRDQSPAHWQRTVLKGIALNAVGVLVGTAALLLWGEPFLKLWAGAKPAASAATILRPIICGSALMGLSVTGTYAMQALGRFRVVALLSLGGRLLMLLIAFYLLHHRGVQGLALARMGYGVIALLVYVPLAHYFISSGKHTRTAAVTPSLLEQQGARP